MTPVTALGAGLLGAVVLGTTLSQNMRSRLLGSLDLLAARLTQKKNSFFPQGLKNRDQFVKAVNTLLNYDVLSAGTPSIEFGDWAKSSTSAIATASFPSPIGEFLPENARAALCQFVVGPEGLAAAVEKRMPWAIHLAATGDEGFGLRRKHIAEPLLSRGVASVILQIPFYGKRRAAGQRGYQLLAVEHMPEQSLGCVAEANAVALYLRNTLGVTAPIVFTGMSFGGAMAALSSSLYPHDHGCVAMVPSHGPAPPFAEGVIAASVCWDTLNLGQQGNVRDALHALFSEMDVTHMTHADDRDRARVYIQLTAMHDHYIPLYSAVRLMDAMRSARHTRAELRMLEGGHVAALLWHAKRAYLDAIQDAAAMMTKQE